MGWFLCIVIKICHCKIAILIQDGLVISWSISSKILTIDLPHYNDIIMSTVVSQINSLTIVYSTVYSGTDQTKHQGSSSLAFVCGIHWWTVNSPHKGPVTEKSFHLMMSSCMGWVHSLSYIQYLSLVCYMQYDIVLELNTFDKHIINYNSLHILTITYKAGSVYWVHLSIAVFTFHNYLLAFLTVHKWCINKN